MRRNGEDVYVKGTTVQVARTDAAGFPLESIERDPDGYLWHVNEGQKPVLLRDESEVRAVFAEAANKGGGGEGGH